MFKQVGNSDDSTDKVNKRVLKPEDKEQNVN